MERLDRNLANWNWINLVPKAHVTCLTRVYSDHFPIKLDLKKNVYQVRFRIESMWLSHPTFKQLVNKTWTNQDNILTAIENFTDRVKE